MDTVYNPCADGTNRTLPSSPITINKVSYSKAWCDASKGHVQLDNYGLARKNNITLRLDELNSGVSTLLQTASTAAQSTVFATPPKYRFSIYSMDSLWQIGLTQLMALTSNYTSGSTTASGRSWRDGAVVKQQQLRQRGVLLEHHYAGRRMSAPITTIRWAS